LFVAIDRVTKFAFAELHEQVTRIAADFLRRLIERLPFHIHTVLTDNGFSIHGTAWRLECQRDSGDARPPSAFPGPRILTSPVPQHGIEHRLT
jgi:hypothetical protein